MHMRMITIGRHGGESLDQFERRAQYERRRRDLLREAHAAGTADRLPLHVRDPEEACRQALDAIRKLAKRAP